MSNADSTRHAAQPASPSEEASCEWLHRDRCVGRWQRSVRWVVIENVIWPDWREVRSGYSRGLMPAGGAS